MLTSWIDDAIITGQDGADGSRWAFGFKLQIVDKFRNSALAAIEQAKIDFRHWKHPARLTRKDELLLSALPHAFIGTLAGYIAERMPVGTCLRIVEKTSRHAGPLEFVWRRLGREDRG